MKQETCYKSESFHEAEAVFYALSEGVEQESNHSFVRCM